MKKILSYGAVALAGYLIGFFEYRYKVTRCIAEGIVDGKIKLNEEVSLKDEVEPE